ncbi:unnamed protein product [Ilex paraguariensis]|uniref:Tr-type G domain-containing protein n=1 Tax=Ilex paraguariensis TaxID=185542 RepID=A0ABC8UFM3_9AQUA
MANAPDDNPDEVEKSDNVKEGGTFQSPTRLALHWLGSALLFISAKTLVSVVSPTMDIEEDIRALQLDSSEDSVMANAPDDNPDEVEKSDNVKEEDSVMANAKEGEPVEVKKTDTMEEGLKDEAHANYKAVDVEPKKVIEEDAEEEVEDNKKRHLNVVFIGHVDAGKSTTGGQILFLSGRVDDRTIQKYEKEAKDKSRESW